MVGDDNFEGWTSSSRNGDDETQSLVMNPETQSSPAQENCISLLEIEMRRKLKFFFMNPVEKWQAKRRFPYKFLVQVVKIVLVTIQLCLFAHNRYNHVTYTGNNRITFSHLFLKGWDPTREVSSYPPALGPLAIYDKQTFYQTLDYAVVGYANLYNAMGPYSYASEDNHLTPPVLCFFHYKVGDIFPFNESYIFNSDIIESCLNVSITENITDFSSQKYMQMQNYTIAFPALIKADLRFSLKTVNYKNAGPMTPSECYQFDVKILFDNQNMDGQMLLSLDVFPIRLQCIGDIKYIDGNRLDYILRTILNVLVIIVCAISFVLCSRAIIKAQQLKMETVYFFRECYKKELSVEGRFEFWNLWYIMIIINDMLIIIGSTMKEQIEREQFVGDQWNTCSMFLGTGNLLVWFGVLRYLGFFKTYNVVILTLKKACPQVARFLLCAILIYAGFTFCGWLILGPYHLKFRSLASTSECLFSLINGDDMYATFSIMSFKSPLLWWFSRMYLYSFISLYIYVVLSLFISVIMDAYETIKLYYKEGFPKNDVQMFMASCEEEPSSGVFRTSSYINSSGSLKRTVIKFCCWRKPTLTSFVLGRKKSHPSDCTAI
ncbi:mucolipin-3 isoform X1 [Nilaparvata lugens]|uniref:mucolipin-3 isoform X1 n=1 Tax=Nilaparvata lugens TaxID=108931 RepID=UPI00193E6FC1|nr:mucolipin-3 isoform X1 [Nilaparvata lugens]